MEAGLTADTRLLKLTGSTLGTPLGCPPSNNRILWLLNLVDFPENYKNSLKKSKSIKMELKNGSIPKEQAIALPTSPPPTITTS